MRGLRVALSVFSIVTGWAATIIDTGPTGAQVAMKSGFGLMYPVRSLLPLTILYSCRDSNHGRHFHEITVSGG